jgi:hypothetical protein
MPSLIGAISVMRIAQFLDAELERVEADPDLRHGQLVDTDHDPLRQTHVQAAAEGDLAVEVYVAVEADVAVEEYVEICCHLKAPS